MARRAPGLTCGMTRSQQYTDISRKQYCSGMATVAMATSSGFPVPAAAVQALSAIRQVMRSPVVAELERMREQALASHRAAYGTMSRVSEDLVRTVSPMHSPVVAELERMREQALGSHRVAYGAMSRVSEGMTHTMSPMRQVLNELEISRRSLRVWVCRKESDHWAKITGLQEHLPPYKRRKLQTETVRFARIKSLLVRRGRHGDAPGRTVTTKPQVTRGPNARRSIASNPPAGLRHV